MDATQRAGLLQRWSVLQEELIPELGREIEGLTPKLTKLIHTLEWARIEDFVPWWQGIGRPPKDRSALANSFVAKAVLGLGIGGVAGLATWFIGRGNAGLIPLRYAY